MWVRVSSCSGGGRRGLEVGVEALWACSQRDPLYISRLELTIGNKGHYSPPTVRYDKGLLYFVHLVVKVRIQIHDQRPLKI